MFLFVRRGSSLCWEIGNPVIDKKADTFGSTLTYIVIINSFD